MSIREEKAIKAFKSIFECDKCGIKEECTIYGGDLNPLSSIDCEGEVYLDAFRTGWDEALKNLWISTEERLPEIGEKVLILHRGYDNMDVRIMKRVLINRLDNNLEWRWSLTKDKYNVIAWMPIPSFDDIIEANKNILKRLKDN